MYHIRSGGHFDGWAFAKGSYLLVDFFFVLSGFVMMHAYAGRINSAGDVLTFAVRRFGRLWPLHVAVLGAYVCHTLVRTVASRWAGDLTPYVPFTGSESLSALLGQVCLMQSVGIYQALSWNAPSWSISAEFWAYLVFGGSLLLPQRLFLKVSASVVVGMALLLILRSGTHMNTTYYLGLARGLCGFFTGVIVYRWFDKYARMVLPYATAWEVLAVLVVGGFVSGFYANDGSFAAPLVFAAAVLVFAYGQGRISAALGHRWVQALGRWSYSVYMIHGFVILLAAHAHGAINTALAKSVWLRELAAMLPNRYSGDAQGLLVLALIVGLSSQTYRFIEEPGRKFFNKQALRYRRHDH